MSLCCTTTLGNPLPNRRFYLHAYASKGTSDVSGILGWAVTQKDDEGGHLPLSFGSTVLKDHDASLYANFLEPLTIIDGFEDNYVWLVVRPVAILSDKTPESEILATFLLGIPKNMYDKMGAAGVEGNTKIFEIQHLTEQMEMAAQSKANHSTVLQVNEED